MASLMSNMMSNMMQSMKDMLMDFRAETREEIAQLRERVDNPLSSHALHRQPVLPTGERLMDARPPIPTQLEPSLSFSNKQENSISTRLHQEKAFAKLLHAAATKFNGKDPLEYAPWK